MLHKAMVELSALSAVGAFTANLASARFAGSGRITALARLLVQNQLQGWIWKSLVAGLCGAIAHTLLISIKVHAGWLPSFQPYLALQRTLNELIGSDVLAIIPWIISYLNSMTVVGLLFGS